LVIPKLKDSKLRILTVLFITWLTGFAYFISLVPNAKADAEKTDAIVVLTGGDKRIEEGSNLFKQKTADKLFITGVDVKVKRLHEVTSCYNALDAEDRQRVEFGQNAEDTMGNAMEVKTWVEQNKITSLTLVTASYHIPRSLMIFKETMPNVRISPYPVFTSNFKIHNWWSYPGTTWLLLKEYTKCLFVFFKVADVFN